MTTPKQAADRAEWWRDGLDHRDWLYDGHAIRGAAFIARFETLDWSKAWIDMGPSIAGNPGPYWHVPQGDGDTVHRLYPKVLASKWLGVIRRACEEARASAIRSAEPQTIETAPKDGRAFMVYVRSSDVGPHWFAPVSRDLDGGWWDDSTGDQIQAIRGATHWMPLPAPPAPPEAISGKEG